MEFSMRISCWLQLRGLLLFRPRTHTGTTVQGLAAGCASGARLGSSRVINDANIGLNMMK